MVNSAFVEQGVGTSFLVLKKGIRLRVVQQGPQAGPAVLMLHGYTDSAFSYRRVLPLMPAGLRVIIPDQRGHGDSDRPLAGYSIDDFATDAIELLDVLGIDGATVVGHSMGSFIARRVAERALDRVSRLILIGTGPTARNQTVRELLNSVRTLTDPVDEGFVREFQTSMIGRPVPVAFLEQVIAESRKVPAHVWRAALQGLIDYTPQRDLRVAALVLGGDLDAAFTVEEQAGAAADFTDGRLHVERGIGHSLQWEAPERFVQLAF